jgi:hypothetical protein
MKLCFLGQTGNRIKRINTKVLRVLMMMMMMDGWKKCTRFFSHHQHCTLKTVTAYSIITLVSFYQPVWCYTSADINATRIYTFVTMV